MLSDSLKILRFEHNLSQDDIAKIVGVTRQAYSKYETGERQPSYDILIKIAKYYNVSTDFLLGLTTVRTIEESNAIKALKNRYLNHPNECLVHQIIDNIFLILNICKEVKYIKFLSDVVNGIKSLL